MSAIERLDPFRMMNEMLRWDPLRGLHELARGTPMLGPASDVKETPDEYVIEADVPGMKEQDLDTDHDPEVRGHQAENGARCSSSSRGRRPALRLARSAPRMRTLRADAEGRVPARELQRRVARACNVARLGAQ